jgi:hypothetical protein
MRVVGIRVRLLAGLGFELSLAGTLLASESRRGLAAWHGQRWVSLAVVEAVSGFVGIGAFEVMRLRIGPK